MPKRLVRTGGRLALIVALVLVALVVVAAATLLAVPQWGASLLPSATITRTAAPPAGWHAPETASPPTLPLNDLDATAAPSAKALAARVARLAPAAAATPGLVVMDPATGRTLLDRADRPLLPASTMKLVTCVAALDALGNGRTFTTAVLGPRKGVIVLRGGGDPLLRDARSTGRASLQQLAATTAAALRKSGTTTVTLGYDDTLFTGPSWHRHWTDNYRYSVAPITALMVDSGFNPRTGKASKRPSVTAAHRFAARLKAQGITVGSTRAMTAPSGAVELAAVVSPPLETVIENTLTYSDNVAAETLARHVGLSTGRGGSFAGAEAGVRATVKKLGLWAAGTVIDDNSGLSRDNRVAPHSLAGAMRLVLTQPAFRTVLLGLPVAGVSGTLYDRYDERSERAGRGTVRAKTGSLRDVSALAGFLVTADGSPLVFAILANHVARPFAVQDWVDRTTAGWASCGCR